ncbi:hypothetical protein FQN57_004057 [Myotisia sp. PD_48]|nr:hypothetical protein FQN57_004057 [Myotisia sp. PD_48]
MSSPSTIRKRALADRIEKFGYIMVRRCSRCAHLGKTCVLAQGSQRCSECVRGGKSRCNASSLTSGIDWDKLIRLSDQLEQEEAAARASAAALSLQISEAFAKISRLEKQRKLLRDKAGSFLQSDAQTLEELECLEAIDTLQPLQAEFQEDLVTFSQEYRDLYETVFVAPDENAGAVALNRPGS